jgi:hypothetical protein
VDSLRIRLVGTGWVREWTLLGTTRCKSGPLVIWTNTSGETSAGTVKLGKAIEKPCSDVLAHTMEMCKGILLYQWYLATKDNHESWGMCTTSIKCKTVMIVMLTVMSSIEPHTIRETWVGMVGLLGVC